MNREARLAALIKKRDMLQKQKAREEKRYNSIMNKLKSLPGVQNVTVAANYINPVTLGPPPRGVVVYHIKDPKTGRVDLYDKVTFWAMLRRYAPNIKNNYNLMMALPRRVLFPNPATRSEITTRNIRRVRARAKPKTPTRSAAARKIVSALRKKVAAKKKNVRKSH